jgi:hypothetical protein
VLETMGVTQEVGLGVIRFSLGRGTTREEIDAVAERLSASPELHSWQCLRASFSDELLEMGLRPHRSLCLS